MTLTRVIAMVASTGSRLPAHALARNNARIDALGPRTGRDGRLDIVSNYGGGP